LSLVISRISNERKADVIEMKIPGVYKHQIMNTRYIMNVCSSKRWK